MGCPSMPFRPNFHPFGWGLRSKVALRGLALAIAQGGKAKQGE